MYISNGTKLEWWLGLENELIECIWIEVLIYASKSFLVCCLYRPPSGSRYLKNNFNEHLRNMLSIATTYINNSFRGCQRLIYLVEDECKDVKQILTLLDFKEPTRTCDTTKTLIDIIASNKPKLIRSTHVFPSGFSDHDLIGCIPKLHHHKFSPKEIKCRD